MNGDREQILASLRRHPVPAVPRPPETAEWIQYASPRDQFIRVLETVGGAAQIVADATAAAKAIADLPAYQQAQRRCCEVSLPTTEGAATLLDWNIRLAETDDPHELASLDFAVLPGQFGVAENAAVWVTDQRLRQRAVYFIAQHLALVIPAERIVHNLHEAYQLLSFSGNTFGCFVSGPSKTADIEQSLVIGAHGARSLTVLLVQDAASCGLAGR